MQPMMLPQTASVGYRRWIVPAVIIGLAALAGFAGQISIGHAAFFRIGALVTRTLWLGGLPFAAAFLPGGLAAAAFAMLIGAPTFRLRGAYFSIGTLGAADLLLRSRWSLGILAVREDEEAAQATGVHILGHKLAGPGHQQFFRRAGRRSVCLPADQLLPRSGVRPNLDVRRLAHRLCRRSGHLAGPVIGAIFFILVRQRLAVSLVEVHQVIFGILFIIIVLVFPGGLVEA